MSIFASPIVASFQQLQSWPGSVSTDSWLTDTPGPATTDTNNGLSLAQTTTHNAIKARLADILDSLRSGAHHDDASQIQTPVTDAEHMPGETSVDSLSAPLIGPSPLNDLADYLTTGFWDDFGRIPRQYNLTDSGTAANNGVLHFNVAGYTQGQGAYLGDDAQGNPIFNSDADGLSDARADLVREAFKIYGEVLGIDFIETTSEGPEVDFFFGDNQSGAYAGSHYYLGGGEIAYSYVNISANWSGGTSDYNDYTLQTILHEIGHAFGMGHQGAYDGNATYGVDNTFENDSWQASMMSYFAPELENTNVDASFAYLQTPMTVDWMALDAIYGAQGFGVENAFTGDTVYGFNTNITSDVSDIWANYADYAHLTSSTIVDGGGIDTVDFSGFAEKQIIDLRETKGTDTEASLSNIGGLVGNLSLAVGTIIENAIGGSKSDKFFGNSADNTFTGNRGNDKFFDSAGNDTYFGGSGTDKFFDKSGSGSDTYSGGNGTDTVVFRNDYTDFTFQTAGGYLEVIGAYTDRVDATVEWLTFNNVTYAYADVLADATIGAGVVLFDFENMDISQDGITFTGLAAFESNLLSGSYVGLSTSNPVVVTNGGDDFDLSTASFIADDARTSVRMKVEAYNDGVLVGTSIFGVRSDRSKDRTFDETFEGVDEIRFYAAGDFMIDDIEFEVSTLSGPTNASPDDTAPILVFDEAPIVQDFEFII